MKRLPEVSVDVPAYFLFPFLLLLIPFRILSSWLLAVIVHELGHIVTAFLFDVEVSGVKFGIWGAKICISPKRISDELVCAIGGPFFGGMLILFGKFFPLIALFAAFQTVYNLLPLPGNDGEKIMCGLLSMILPCYATRVVTAVQWLCVFGMILICILGFSFIPILPVIFLLLLLKSVKIPCKRWEQIVQ